MQWFVDHFYFFIVAVGLLHFAALFAVYRWRKHQAEGLAAYLSNLVKTFASSSDLDPRLTVSDRIDRFITDIREVLSDRQRHGDRSRLYHRLVIKDELRRDVEGTKLETWYNVLRTGIEAYPLLGILGTVLAIGLGLSVPAAPPPAAPAAAVAADVRAAGQAPAEAPAASTSTIVRNFANSIWSTCAGILFAVVLMLVNAAIEPGFERLHKHRESVRDVIGAAKVSLGMEVAGAPAEAMA